MNNDVMIGMGYVAAFLITMMPEEDAFWFMVHLIHNFGNDERSSFY